MSRSTEILASDPKPILEKIGYRFDEGMTWCVLAWIVFEIPWVIGTYVNTEQMAAMIVAKSTLCTAAMLSIRGWRVARYGFVFLCGASAVAITLQAPRIYKNSTLFAVLFLIEALLKLTAVGAVLHSRRRLPSHMLL